ncbi:MAG: ABC transporter ATP-binding protein [Phocaeicola sp.]
MIKVNRLSINQGCHTLFRNLSFGLSAGESICICGESGSGKSSLLKALAGFIPISEGTILIDGLQLNEQCIDDIRKIIAWVPQELSLPIEWVSDMVRLPFQLAANKDAPFDEKILFSHFKELGLSEGIYHKRVNEISGGERQRIMLSVTAMLQKKIVLVDEPTSALDAQSTQLVINFFQRLCKEKGMAIVVVSHDECLTNSCNQVIRL